MTPFATRSQHDGAWDCRIPDCPRFGTEARPICRSHWRRLPEDIRLRLRDAMDDPSDRFEYEAAIHMAQEFLEDSE